MASFNHDPVADDSDGPAPLRTASRLRFLKPLSAMARKSVAYRDRGLDSHADSPAAGITQNLEARTHHNCA